MVAIGGYLLQGDGGGFHDGAPEGEYDAIVLHGANDPDDGDEEPQAPTKKIAVPMKYKDAKTSGLLVTIKKGETNALPLNLKTK